MRIGEKRNLDPRPGASPRSQSADGSPSASCQAVETTRFRQLIWRPLMPAGSRASFLQRSRPLSQSSCYAPLMITSFLTALSAQARHLSRLQTTSAAASFLSTNSSTSSSTFRPLLTGRSRGARDRFATLYQLASRHLIEQPEGIFDSVNRGRGPRIYVP